MMAQPKIIALSEMNLPELLPVAIDTFTETFGPPINDAQDFNTYMKEAFTAEKFRSELSRRESHFFGIYSDSVLVGYLKINHGPAQTEAHPPEWIEIERIYVLKKMYGRGLGTQLMQFAINWAAAHKFSIIWLGVWEHNSRALSFYRRHGFEIYDQHTFNFGRDRQTDVLMKLEI